MDKPTKIKRSISAMRKGFALLITLSVLGVLMGLTGILLGYFDTVRKDALASNALIQGNLYYADTKKIIKGFKEKKILFNTLYQMPIPISSPDERFNIILKCKPVANGVNINWLGEEDNATMSVQYDVAEKIFEALVEKYAIVDAERLKELLLAEIKNKEDSFEWDGSNRLFQKNGIISFKQFQNVVERYQFEVDDPGVSRIRWRKFFFFAKDIKLMDGDYLSPELISLLFDIDVSGSEWVEGTTKLKDFVKENGGTYDPKLFAKDFMEEAMCDVQYTYRNERYAFTFLDDQGEVKNFEFDGKQ